MWIALGIIAVLVLSFVLWVLHTCREGNVEWDLSNEEFYLARKRHEAEVAHAKWVKEREREKLRERKERENRRKRNLKLLQTISDVYDAPEWALEHIRKNTCIEENRGETAVVRTAKVLQYYKEKVTSLKCPMCDKQLYMKKPVSTTNYLTCKCERCGYQAAVWLDETWWEGRVDSTIVSKFKEQFDKDRENKLKETSNV